MLLKGMLGDRFAHRVYRVPGFLSSRPRWFPPPPQTPRWLQRETHSKARGSIIPLRLCSSLLSPIQYTSLSISLHKSRLKNVCPGQFSTHASFHWWAPILSHYWKENICLCGLISQLPIFVQYLFASYMDR
jgi:hypothetical protein